MSTCKGKHVVLHDMNISIHSPNYVAKSFFPYRDYNLNIGSLHVRISVHDGWKFSINVGSKIDRLFGNKK